MKAYIEYDDGKIVPLAEHLNATSERLLRARVDELEEAFADEAKRVKDFYSRSQAAEARVLQIEAENIEHRARVHELEATLKGRFEGAEGTVSKAVYNLVFDDMKRLQDVVRDRKNEINGLERELKGVREENGKLGILTRSLRAQVKILERGEKVLELRENKRGETVSQDTYNRVFDERGRLGGIVCDLQREIAELKAGTPLLDRDNLIKELKECVRELQAQIRDLEGGRAQLIGELRARVAELEEENNRGSVRRVLELEEVLKGRAAELADLRRRFLAQIRELEGARKSGLEEHNCYTVTQDVADLRKRVLLLEKLEDIKVTGHTSRKESDDADDS